MIFLNNRGVKIEVRKNGAFHRAIEEVKPLKTAIVPLSTFGTSELVPVASVGGNVVRFTPLAISPSGRHAIISPVSGVLLGVDPFEHPILGKINCAKISVNYKIPDAELIPSDILQVTGWEIIQIAKGAGIVDEYDGIPLYRKLTEYARNKVGKLAGDAIDDTPYVSSGVKTVAEYGNIAASGLELCMRATGAESGAIYTYDLGGREMRRIQERYRIIDVETVAGNYPVWTALEKKLTNENGFGRIGVQALAALHRAVAQGFPQTQSIITVSGDAVINAGNYLVTQGLTVGELLEKTGLKDNLESVILGDVMTGVLCTDFDTPLFPGIRAVIAISKKSVESKSKCIGCGRCVESCPAGVLPYYAVRLAEQGDMYGAKKFGTENCINCGVCSAVCPAGREMSECIRQIESGCDFVTPYSGEEDSNAKI